MYADADLISLNVGGRIFTTRWKTFKNLPNGFANKLIRDGNYDELSKSYFFDQDPCIFESVLRFCRTGKFHLSRQLCIMAASEELSFWGMDAIATASTCSTCREMTTNGQDDVAEEFDSFLAPFATRPEDVKDLSKLRRNIWLLVEDSTSSKAAKVEYEMA